MGNPICTNLIKIGHYDVTVFDVNAARMRNPVESGACSASSVGEAVAGVDLVMTSLPGPRQVDEVGFGENGIFANVRQGTGWIDLSTNSLEVCDRIVATADKHGMGFLDSPVSGGDEGAIAGTLTILVGGRKSVFEKYLPVLEAIGENITCLGTNGSGYAAKISQVILCYLHSLALSEALMLGIKGGVRPGKMLNIIQNSTGRSYVADRYGPSVLAGDYDPSFALGLAHKDMKLAEEMACNLGIRLPLCELTTQTYARAVKEYGFEANHLEVVRLLEEDNALCLQE